ncbi:MAG: hypothetical protein RL557_609 [archaeon]|jgi:ribosome biogenesis GTPase A
MEPYWDLVKRIVKESDVVLEILDGRLVALSRNEEVEKIVIEVGRPLIYVINKSDLVSKKNLEKQIEQLQEEHYPIVFVSIKDRTSIRILLQAIKKAFTIHGKRDIVERKVGDPKLKFREAKADIVVGVLGYPNVGKSSVINALAHKQKAKVSKKAGTTHGIHWIRASDEIKLIDSPGVIPLQKDDDLRYGLIGARDSQNLRHPEVVAYFLIELFLKENKKDFESWYNIQIQGDNGEEILAQIALKKGKLLKGGIPDETRAAMIVVQDWQQGKLKL